MPDERGATVAEKQRSAWSEASRSTYGALYWSFTALLTLATIAAWLWGDQSVRFAVGVTGIVFVIGSGIVQHWRMNRIARERGHSAQGERDG
jgi:hypothetical protein